MKKILCPIDFSSDSINAIEFAAHIGEQHHSTLTLIHVFTEEEFGEALSQGLLNSFENIPEWDDLVATAEKVLKRLTNEVNELSKPKGLLQCDYHFTYGPLNKQISSYAEEHGYDLIVMGTTGVKDVVEKYIGSNTVRTISLAHCPVMGIPENAKYHKVKKVVFASDYQMEDKDILNKLIAFTASTDAELDIVHVCPKDNKIEEAMYNEYVEQTKTYLNYPKLKFAVEYHDDPAHGIDAYVIRENADLLALLYKPRNAIQRIFNESTAREIAYFATYPVLIFKE
ncbi:universal stress protein [Catalinimonas niigatensis]|uniref:universal stress protein n=1 Tax=Catalinimonas niigatensis TaxID=1397264 RepID=UPI002666E5AF|nr:universal stress protein [Catalinimonas niigatensis]WPP51005.1 universal stress protein [Catalinimonas niigatensis]